MTKIEWTKNTDGSQGETWNPTTGCTDISPGCKNCYARTMHARLHAMGQAKYSEPFHTVRFHPDALDAPLKRRKPTTYFVNSMSDLFHKDVTNEQIARVFFVMVGEASAEPSGVQVHRFQILTKRPARMLEWFTWAAEQHEHDDPEIMSVGLWARYGGTSKNLWLGVSCEDQQRADERIPLLLQAPAAVRGVSLEPLLGEIDLSRFMWPVCASWPAGYRSAEEASAAGAPVEHRRQSMVSSGARFLDWVICGSESGPGARPMDLDWVRSLRDQCVNAGVPFFYKQKTVGGKKIGMPEIDGRIWAEMPDRGPKP